MPGAVVKERSGVEWRMKGMRRHECGHEEEKRKWQDEEWDRRAKEANGHVYEELEKRKRKEGESRDGRERGGMAGTRTQRGGIRGRKRSTHKPYAGVSIKNSPRQHNIQHKTA